MDPLVADFLQCVRRTDPCHLITENSIVTGRVSLLVAPSVSAPVAHRLVLLLPADGSDEEVRICTALKSLLVGYGNLPVLFARLRGVSEFTGRYEGVFGEWKLQYHVSGARKTLKAERIQKLNPAPSGAGHQTRAQSVLR
ncbi:MAG: hypothetical protein V4726_02140 [Verrucomicrobiota bacterium]